MDEMITEFYVTLPSNSSMQYFPSNTQSSFRTKLSAPLMLTGEWEVGIREISIPRNWFNVGMHNNDYIIDIEAEKKIVVDHIEHDVSVMYKGDPLGFFIEINEYIKSVIQEQECVIFVPDVDNENVTIGITEGFKIRLTKEHAPKLLYMLHLPNEDIIINKTTSVKFRASTDTQMQKFTIIDERPLDEKSYIIPVTPIKPKERERHNSIRGIFQDIKKNITELSLQNHLILNYEPIKNELEITVSEYAELHITKKESESVLKILNSNEDIIVKGGTQKFKVNPLLPVTTAKFSTLIIKEYPTITKIENETKYLYINVGMYKSAKSLFREFQHINLRQLPDLKVLLDVPNECKVTFGSGLANMLGFESTSFKTGIHVGKYPLELDAGITEIFIYSDIIHSHHVGDSYVPLLGIIPCMNETNDQIVKHYDTPIYFPLRKNFVDTIEIELKTASGNNIIFTGGKTLVLLSFCRRKRNL